MNDRDLGQALRDHLMREQQQGRPLVTSRLQAVLNDLVSADQQPLLPALRALVLSNAFASAIRQEPPLADDRLLPRLQQELASTYSLEVRQRMDAVLAGLFDQPLEPEPPTAPSPAVAATAPATPATATSDHRSMGCGLGLLLLTAVLAALAGVAMALLGGGVALWLRHRQPQPQAEAPAAIVPPAAPTSPILPPESPPTDAPNRDDIALSAARESLGNLYNALSAKDATAARAYYDEGSSDQFDPAFFNQFASVTLSDLKETGRSGSQLLFSGVVTFHYPDGTSQIESRTFTVDTSRSPAVVTASSFGRVIRLRS